MSESGTGWRREELIAEVKRHLHSGAIQLPLRVEGWHKSLSDGGHYIRHSTGRTLATVEFVPVENETGRPALDGNAPARAVVAILNAAPALLECASTPADAEQLNRLREAGQVALQYLDNLSVWLPYPRNKEAQNIAHALRNALSPQGGETNHVE